MNAESLTRALGGRWHGSYGTARCPAHDDRERVNLIADRQPRNHARLNRMIERILSCLSTR